MNFWIANCRFVCSFAFASFAQARAEYSFLHVLLFFANLSLFYIIIVECNTTQKGGSTKTFISSPKMQSAISVLSSKLNNENKNIAYFSCVFSFTRWRFSQHTKTENFQLQTYWKMSIKSNAPRRHCNKTMQSQKTICKHFLFLSLARSPHFFA